MRSTRRAISTVPLPDIADRLGVAAASQVERVLGVVQSFDPTGVGARDLAECLALQAKEADRYDPAMAALIGHLDLLARGDLRAAARASAASTTRTWPT